MIAAHDLAAMTPAEFEALVHSLPTAWHRAAVRDLRRIASGQHAMEERRRIDAMTRPNGARREAPPSPDR